MNISDIEFSYTKTNKFEDLRSLTHIMQAFRHKAHLVVMYTPRIIECYEQQIFIC